MNLPEPKRLPDGRWTARYSAPPGADGKRRQPRVYGRTKKECTEALVAAIGHVQAGRPADDRRTKYGDHQRMAWAGVWTDTGRVFTREDGTALRPAHVSERFDTLVSRLGLPPVTLHGLRHGSATMALAAGVPIKAISEMLGHATSAFTADVYTEVAEELAEAAAAAIAAFIPRRAKTVPNGGGNER